MYHMITSLALFNILNQEKTVKLPWVQAIFCKQGIAHKAGLAVNMYRFIMYKVMQTSFNIHLCIIQVLLCNNQMITTLILNTTTCSLIVYSNN